MKKPHPVYAAYMGHAESRIFSDEKVRRAVIPAYMGLVRQIDDHLARLFAFLETSGLMDSTMIVFCSDHGDYLGDHWLGDKELFHDAIVRTPLIIYDPERAADAARGSVSDALVEAIDLAPTFVAAFSGPELDHILEGRSLLPLLRGGKWRAREAAVSELDYAYRPARTALGVAPAAARAYMVRTARWKYIHYEGFGPQLFDLRNDPRERADRGGETSLGRVRREMADRLFEWSLGRRMRITVSDAEIARMPDARDRGIIFGEW